MTAAGVTVLPKCLRSEVTVTSRNGCSPRRTTITRVSAFSRTRSRLGVASESPRRLRPRRLLVAAVTVTVTAAGSTQHGWETSSGAAVRVGAGGGGCRERPGLTARSVTVIIMMFRLGTLPQARRRRRSDGPAGGPQTSESTRPPGSLGPKSRLPR